MKIIYSLLSLIFLFVFIPQANSQSSVEVNTSCGIVQGNYDQKSDLSIFLGVPYAKPPVDELRWKAPQNLDPWKGIKETKQFGP